MYVWVCTNISFHFTAGLAVWSVFGALLMCVQNPSSGGDLFNNYALPMLHMDWGFEGYELLLIPHISEDESKGKQEVSAGDILSMKFVKSALTVNPCMSNRHHLFLQGTLFYTYRQLGCLAFSLRFWPKIKQLLSNCSALDWTFSFKTGDFCIIV